MEALKRAIVRYAQQHANADGLAVTPVPGLRMMCARAPTGPIRSIYKPLVCLVLQGAKEMAIGEEIQTFSAGQSIIVGLDVPVTGRIVTASQERPYIALAVELDMAVVRELATQLDMKSPPRKASAPAFFVEDTEAAALDCGFRLMQLLDRLDAVPVLRPGIIKELHYWLLYGTHGATIRRLALPGGYPQRIAAAVKLLRTQFDKPLRVEALAASAGMSASTFHRQFRALTSLSPVQFQKQLRLIEARRLMLNEGRAANRAAFDVGYESVSQFSREYARMFGAPPRRDTHKKPAAEWREISPRQPA
jgi:AraC-like DNA-binding protein